MKHERLFIDFVEAGLKFVTTSDGRRFINNYN